MKKIILLILVNFVCSFIYCQNKIPIDAVSQHVGETVQVCSKVYGVKSTGKVTFVNLGAQYPHSQLTVVIFAKDNENFKGSIESLYNNKQICATGLLRKYQRRTEIVVTKPDDITIQ